MVERRAYPVYISLSKENCTITIPDFEFKDTSDTINNLATAMECARDLIEKKAKFLKETNEEIPEPNSKPYKKNRGEIFTYIDVDLNRYITEGKTIHELEEMEKRRVQNMWNVNENVIEFLRNSKVITVTLVQTKYVKKVKKYAELFPDEVHIIAENKDGSIYAKLPISYFKISRPPKRVEMSEEEKERRRKLLEKARLKKIENGEKELNEANDSLNEEDEDMLDLLDELNSINESLE